MLHLVERGHLVAELLEIGRVDLDADNGAAFVVFDFLAVLLNKAVAKRIVLGEAFGEDAIVPGGDVPDFVSMGQNRPELIFRTAYHLAGCTKPMKRLWISSMEDSAIREGFDSLRPGSDYDGLHQAALCRQKADWLVGINATRLFSVLYGRTLNIGRVMSPTLALIAQREAEIAAFEPVPFYTVELDCGGVTLTGERISGKEDAAAIAAACEGSAVTIQTVERREKSEKAPALYDLTTLQRDANRTLGYTAQQTLDYLQALYEKKLCTYPRTDSRYLTDDMENAVPMLVSAAAVICGVDAPGTALASQVCSSKNVTDHHAVVPTKSAVSANDKM